MLGLWMFAAAVVLLLIGYPVAFSLGGTAVLFTVFGSDFLPSVVGLDIPWEPAFRMARLNILPQRIYGNIMANYTLVAVPFFVFMGVMLEKSGLAEDLLETMGILFGAVRGGLAISVVAVGALLAASTGVVGASVVTMGVLALPVMLKYNYSKELATGVVASSGTLGQIIPPSIVLVILGDQIGVSVGSLFLGAFIPGFMLAALFMLWVCFVALTRPKDAPALPIEARTLPPISSPLFVRIILLILGFNLFSGLVFSAVTGLSLGNIFFKIVGAIIVSLVSYISLAGSKWSKQKRLLISLVLGLIGLGINFLFPQIMEFQHAILITAILGYGFLKNWKSPLLFQVVKNLLPPLFLILVVLGTIFVGLTTPTEAGAVGAVGAMLLAAVNRRLNLSTLKAAMDQTVKLTSMVFIILTGATAFSMVFTALHGDRVVQSFLQNLPGGQWGFLFFAMLIIFLLGFFIDFIEITFIVVPLLAPIALGFYGLDGMVWFGVLIAMNLQASFLTPPFGFALFYLKGVAPPSIKTTDIYRGIIPFIIIQLVAVLLIAVFPQIVTWLPSIANTQ